MTLPPEQACQNFQTLPSYEALCSTANDLANMFTSNADSSQYLSFLEEEVRNSSPIYSTTKCSAWMCVWASQSN